MDDNYWVAEGQGEGPPIFNKRKRRVAVRKIEFLGWASKRLIEFLEAVNVDTEKEYSKLELVRFILRYIKEKSLCAEGKKKTVICDERLFSLFGKKSISTKKIHELLEEHLCEESDESDDESLDSSEEKDKRKKAFTTMGVKSHRSFFAAIVPRNIKLIYLKKSLIMELLHDRTSFEKKIVGSFVRMKSNTNDNFQTPLFHLQLVTGVENFSLAVSPNAEIHLKVANFLNEVTLSMLSDEDFLEEEVEDVHKRVICGVLKKFSVKEIELKAQLLHEDITKHRIAKELSVLQKKINHANEKGWRRELFEYLDQRKMLQTQEKLLPSIPDVIAEERDASSTAEARAQISESNCLFDADACSSGDSGFVNLPSLSQSHCSDNQQTSVMSTDGFATVKSPSVDGRAHLVNIADVLPHENNGHMHDPINAGKETTEAYMPSPLEENISSEMSYPEKLGGKRNFSFGIEDRNCEEKEAGMDMHDSVSVYTSTTEKERVMDTGCSTLSDSPKIQKSSMPPPAQEFRVKAVATDEIIELSSDEDESEPEGNAEPTNIADWHYVDPRGKMHGPFSLQALKRWNDNNFFKAGFSVWKTGQAPSDGVLLVDVLRRSFR